MPGDALVRDAVLTRLPFGGAVLVHRRTLRIAELDPTQAAALDVFLVGGPLAYPSTEDLLATLTAGEWLEVSP
jgi:hypothetical protein